MIHDRPRISRDDLVNFVWLVVAVVLIAGIVIAATAVDPAELERARR